MTDGAPAAPDGRRRFVALSALSLALVSLDQGIPPPLLPSFAQSLATSPALASRLVSCYAVGAGVLPLLAGPWSDRRGRAAPLVAGLFLFFAGDLCFVAARSLLAASLARAITGTGAGLVSFSVTSAIGDLVSYRGRTSAMATLMAANLTALIAGPALVALIGPGVPAVSFFAAFAALAVPAGIAVKGAAALLGSAPPDASRFIPYFEFFRRRDAALGLAVAFFSSAAIVPPIVFLSSYLDHSFGFGVRDVGLVYLAACASPLLSAAFSARLSRRFSNRALIAGTAAPLAAAILLLEPLARFGTIAVPVLFAVAALVQTVRAAALQSLHTALVPEIERGSYIVLKNAVAQGGIAAGAFAGGFAFGDGSSFLGVAAISAAAAILSALATLPILEHRLPGRGEAFAVHREGLPPV